MLNNRIECGDDKNIIVTHQKKKGKKKKNKCDKDYIPLFELWHSIRSTHARR